MADKDESGSGRGGGDSDSPVTPSRMTLKDATSKVKQEALRSMNVDAEEKTSDTGAEEGKSKTPDRNPSLTDSPAAQEAAETQETVQKEEGNPIERESPDNKTVKDDNAPDRAPSPSVDRLAAPERDDDRKEESVAPESTTEGGGQSSSDESEAKQDEEEVDTDDGRTSEVSGLAEYTSVDGRTSEASARFHDDDDDDGSYGGDYSDSSLDVKQPTSRRKAGRRRGVKRVVDSESDTGREQVSYRKGLGGSVSMVREEEERVESRRKPRGKTRAERPGDDDDDDDDDVGDEEEEEEEDEGREDESTEKIVESSSPPLAAMDTAEEDTAAVVKEETEEKETEEKEEEEDDVKDEDQVKEEPDERKVESHEVELVEETQYDYEALKSKPVTSEAVTSNLIELYHSFGFECQRRSNLHLLDDNTLMFIAGNVIQIVNTNTQEQKYVRSTTGGGIGAIAVHPSYQFFAVAEKGDNPPIVIYHYPSLKVFRVLESGTQLAYSHLSFNHRGDKLASVGSYPDYMLTVWDWRAEQIILRTKAFSQEVYRVSFSTENEGQLTTSGTGHIRFWKMASTFTGLKLQGDIGKFGRTELSDISGYVELPDGKVLSGTEWGNMLLWDGGLIKVEISKKKKPCHNGMIEDIFLDEGELITVGSDGYIKVWDFDTIDSADITEENSIFEMEPMTEIKIGNDVSLKSLVRSRDPDTPYIWFGQDANGGIWKIDVSVSHTRKSPTRLFSYHAGKVVQVAVCPVAHLAATIGVDASVRLYDYVSTNLLAAEKFLAPGSCLVWAPKQLDKKGSTLLAGFEDGVVRVLSVISQALSTHAMSKSTGSAAATNVAYSLELSHVFKPHSSSVTALAINRNGDILASGSNDCTVFFMAVGDPYEPIGFIKTPSPVMSLQWIDRQGPKVVAFCRDGSVLEIESPRKDDFNTSKTFYLDPLDFRTFKFTSIKKRLLEEEKEAILKAEEEARRLAEEARRRALGSDDEDDEKAEEEKPSEIDQKTHDTEKEKENEQEEDEEEEEEEKVVEDDGKLLCGFYDESEHQFVVSMDGFDAGYLYFCHFDDETSGEPRRAVKLPEINNKYETNLTATHFTSNGRYMFFGTSDGWLRCHELPAARQIGNLDRFWTISMHDNHHGAIASVTTSHDDKYVFTTGADGNMFAYAFHGDVAAVAAAAVEPTTSRVKVGHGASAREEKIDDIDDPTHYSIEEAKQKAEHDRMVRLAEEKKMGVRREVGLLRRKFKELARKNQTLPETLQMGKDEFVLDPHLREEMETQTKHRIDLVRKEMAWESEKCRIALEKMKRRFKDVVECDRIVVRAVEGPYEVATFRSVVPSSDYLTILSAYRERATSDDEREEDEEEGEEEADGGPDARHRRQSVETSPAKDDRKETIAAAATSKARKRSTKEESLKQKRLQRQKEWDDLWKSKPDEHYEDSADIVAIENAKRTMGDFKLKTASDYVVADDQRIDVEKKRTQIVLLREQIFEKKRYFNVKLIALRDKKVALVAKIEKDLNRLADLQNELGPSLALPLPSLPVLFPEEVPEKKYEATVDELKEFKRKYELGQAEKDRGGQKDDGGGFFGGFGGQGEQKKEEVESEAAVVSETKPKDDLKDSVVDVAEAAKDEEEELSELEQQVEKARKMRITYERDCLLEKVRKTIRNFDLEVRALRHEKQYLEVALKQCDLRHVTQYEELLLLKEFEKRETVFAGKVAAKQTEKTDMMSKVSACETKLASKQKDIVALQDREKDVHHQFVASLGENNKFAEFLTKVFKKKIKRVKKKESAERESESESDDESSDEEWSSSDEESDSEGGGVDDTICPVGCPDELFEGALKLREERLDVEEMLVEEKKTAETLRREAEALKKKLKIIELGLKNAEADLQAFQLEKQAKLNELDVVVTLYLHQIQYVVGGTLPGDLSSTLVFSNSVIEKLQKRITELGQEKMHQKRLYKDNRLTYKQLAKEKKGLDAKVGELAEKADEMMMLKFGRVVRLEKLEGVTVNRAVEELREKLRHLEKKQIREQERWQGELDAMQEQLTTVLRENTTRLDAYNQLLLKQKDLEEDLANKQKTVGNEYATQRQAELRERRRLMDLLKLQSEEIEGLKEEITLLSSKGGHIVSKLQEESRLHESTLPIIKHP